MPWSTQVMSVLFSILVVRLCLKFLFLDESSVFHRQGELVRQFANDQNKIKCGMRIMLHWCVQHKHSLFCNWVLITILIKTDWLIVIDLCIVLSFIIHINAKSQFNFFFVLVLDMCLSLLFFVQIPLNTLNINKRKSQL